MSNLLDPLWVDAAMVLGFFAVGNVLFGHFEMHRPRWRRLLKMVFVVALVLGLSATVGRAWAWGMLLLSLLAAAYIHAIWLPRRGVNGWTGEPRERYLEIVMREP